MAMIHFGTSGWRDIISDGFTFAGATALTRAVARRLKARKLAARGVLVGYDYRFLAEEFARRTALTLAEEGVPAKLVAHATPTPALAVAIREHKLAGGINFTASHNPAEYQGYKWSNEHGGPATKEEVAPIEREANRLLAAGGGRPPRGVRPARISTLDPRPLYFRQLSKVVPFAQLKKSRLHVVADPLFGAGRHYLDEALRLAGCRVELLHDWRDVLFGGMHPEPDADNLAAAAARMKKTGARLALGTDGDADRFGIVDADGTYLTPNQVLALTLHLLVKHRGLQGRVVRSVVSSHLVDAVAKHYGMPVEVTPVGFKYIGESMLRGGFLLGGEESGGLTIAGHIPEKDGILACLLMAELVVRERKTLQAVLRDLYRRVGLYLTDRVNFKLDSPAAGQRLRKKLSAWRPRRLAGEKVSQIETLDGYKFLLASGAWLAIRLSGTEPMARLYLEARDRASLKRVRTAGRALLSSGRA